MNFLIDFFLLIKNVGGKQKLSITAKHNWAISACACNYYSVALLGKQFPLSEIVAIRKVKVKQKCKSCDAEAGN